MSGLSVPTFTNLGFGWHSRRFEDLDADLSGNTALITGATGGIGLAAAKGIHALGADVVLVGRNEEKLRAIVAELDRRASFHVADLSLLADIGQLAEQLIAEESRLDVLVNNVGVLVPERTLTTEGLELSFATNLAGHFLLTNSLMPLLMSSAPSRVINVTSGGMYAERIAVDDLMFTDGYNGTKAYARTKRGQVILTELWAERLQGSEVSVNAMHPGWARTAGVKTSLPTFNRLMGPLLRTPEQGADTIVWLSSSSEGQSMTGRFWFDRQPAKTHLLSSTRETEDERQRLWSELVEVTGSDLVVRAD